MCKTSCKSPRVLFNRGLVYAIKDRGFYHNSIFHSISYNTPDDIIFEMFSPYKLGLCRYRNNKDKSDGFIINWKELDSYYTFDLVGTKQPLFFLSDCGSCSSCQHKKMLNKAQRLQDEALTHPCMPLFCTLTYNNEFLPPNGVDKRQVQLFLKRLRHLLPPFRYYLTAEYGKNTFRPHYHLLLFGLNYNINIPSSFEPIIDSIKKSWSSDSRSNSSSSFGFIDVRPVRDFKGFIYVSKYSLKNNRVPIGKNPTFALQSRRPGLGANLLNVSMFKHFLETPHHDYLVRNPHSSSSPCQIFKPQRYYLRKLLPSYSDYFNLSFRRLFDNISNTFSYLFLLGRVGLKKYVNRFLNIIKNLPFSYSLPIKNSSNFSFTFLSPNEINNIEESLNLLEKYAINYDNERLLKYMNARNQLLTKFNKDRLNDYTFKRLYSDSNLCLLDDKIKL